MNQENAFGNYIRNLRKSFGFSQMYVAAFLNVIPQTYSHYETGRSIPPADAIYILSKLYQVPAENLLKLLAPKDFEWDDEPYPMVLKTPDELSDFQEHVNNPKFRSRFYGLTPIEKQMLYYFAQLDVRRQKRITATTKEEAKYQN